MSQEQRDLEKGRLQSFITKDRHPKKQSCFSFSKSPKVDTKEQSTITQPLVYLGEMKPIP